MTLFHIEIQEKRLGETSCAGSPQNNRCVSSQLITAIDEHLPSLTDRVKFCRDQVFPIISRCNGGVVYPVTAAAVPTR